MLGILLLQVTTEDESTGTTHEDVCCVYNLIVPTCCGKYDVA